MSPVPKTQFRVRQNEAAQSTPLTVAALDNTLDEVGARVGMETNPSRLFAAFPGAPSGDAGRRAQKYVTSVIDPMKPFGGDVPAATV
jgi:hypothetical protein